MISQLWTGLALAALMAGAAWPASEIEIGQPWSPATPPVAKVGAGYGTITNHGSQTDRLLGGSSPIATRVELHELRHNADKAEMRLVKEGVEIAPGATLELQPGSYHLMLVGLTRPLRFGESVPITLEFEKAGPIEAEFTIRPAAKRAAASHDQAGHDPTNHGGADHDETDQDGAHQH